MTRPEPVRGARRDWGWVFVLASLSFAIAPLVRPGLPSVADAVIHFFRTAEWVRVWGAGVLYPRWSPNLAFGYGFPLFIFAPPLPYAIAGSLYEVGLSLATAIKTLPALSFVLMGVGMYLCVRDVFGAKAGVVSAAAFAYAPFTLREAYIYGGNYPQLLAIAIFPWLLWTFRRAALNGRPVDVTAAAVAYAALITSHLFHAMIFTPVIAVYALGLALTGRLEHGTLPDSQAVARPWSVGLRSAAAGLLGLALSAAFWAPALYERRWSVANEAFYLTRSVFALRFLSFRELLASPQPIDSRAANPYIPFALGWGILLFVALGLLACVMWRRWSASRRCHLAFVAALLAISAFMVLPVSEPVWAGAPLLAVGEFPWRFMGIAGLAAAGLAGASVLWLERMDRRAGWPAAAVVVLLIVGGSATMTYPRPFLPVENPTLADGLRYELSTQTIGTTTLGEYVPVWVKDVPLTSPLVDDYLAGRPIDKLDRTTLPAGASAERLEHSAVLDSYRVSSPTEWTLRLNTFYYPGWTAAVDGRSAETAPDSPRALVSVRVPAGEHVVSVRFVPISVRTAAGGVSVVAGVLAILALAYARLRRGGASFALSSAASGTAGPDDTLVLSSAWTSGQTAALALILCAFALKVAGIDPQTDWFRRHSPPDAVIGAEHPVRVNFGNKVALLGYDLAGEPAMPGDAVHLRLYWQALGPTGADYSTFVHLDMLPDLKTRAQSDNVHPGDARAQIDVPVRTWTTDSYVRDEHNVAIPGDLPPVAYALRVGLYGRDGRRLTVRDADGRPAGDAAFLQPIHVVARTAPDLKTLSDAGGYRLGDRIEVAGTRLESGSLSSGDSLHLHVFWRAAASPAVDYTVFVHVLDAASQIVAQADGPPVGGAYPTSWWWLGQAVEDVREVALKGVPPGSYRLALGMYDPATGERLPVTAGGREAPDRQIVLEQKIEVTGP
jgi:hypothetical protein